MGKQIVLGVTGSIAAYKAAEIASGLVKAKHDVHVMLTQNASKFISPLTFETITHNRAYTDMFRDEDHRQVTHVVYATGADLFLVAPATFNIIGKAANGIADDLLSSSLAAASWQRVMIAPAMNTHMYENPANKENMRRLRERGAVFIEPEVGILACGVVGNGRLCNVPDILDEVEGFFIEKTLKGKKVLITAGATREYLDPIRFISNSSSGLMGVSLAKACRNMGADVTLILSNSTLSLRGVRIIRTDTVAEMADAALASFSESDIVFAAAAVSDYKPLNKCESKIKKNEGNICVEFARNIDILKTMGERKTHQLLIGFAAESENLLENAREKMERKNLDAIIANDLSNFASQEGKVCVINNAAVRELPRKPKEQLAYDIVSAILEGRCL